MTAEPTVTELFNLQGRVALVTGAAGYLGTAFATALAEAGASVVVASSSDRDRAQALADRLPSPHGASHFSVLLDQMEEASCESGFAAAVEQAGRVDILVNNGHEGCGRDLTQVTHAEFARHQQNNAGYFVLARLLHAHVTAAGRAGSVILVGSMYGQVGSYPDTYDGVCAASPVSYHALKGGVIHMTRHLAVYWAKDGVRVNCLSPGPFPNGEKVAPELVRRLNKKSPMGRMGSPHELKGALLFLASDAASYVTGQNLTVDGGWTAW
ncbi:SDR family NAD(P)-dependent oxidoreductase [Lignipirellula cremea]|uniref:3-oxoacyl-[acyl-carrier-protein] reductase FabG n=1 Tax=Lignipirellula cremea TaxID=2528010 RepID=A0A518DUU1_9BACT|nr:SDR family oxidoreductase [Lignipirellula cremea]QDU95594.1 3-oxoacyl-[acyl-carrier-protein] reductase FabG [Lignipirellula cremea]